MTAHDHSELVPGCYRCDLGRAEQAGREDNADHGMCYVSGSDALVAKLADAWDEGESAAIRGFRAPGLDPEPNPYRKDQQ